MLPLAHVHLTFILYKCGYFIEYVVHLYCNFSVLFFTCILLRFVKVILNLFGNLHDTNKNISKIPRKFALRYNYSFRNEYMRRTRIFMCYSYKGFRAFFWQRVIRLFNWTRWLSLKYFRFWIWNEKYKINFYLYSIQFQELFVKCLYNFSITN